MSEEHTTDNTDLHRLLGELMNTKEQPVFRTYVPGGLRKIVLCTTNEKVHLSLGKLTDAGLETLANLFKEKLEVDGELIFSFQQNEGSEPSRNLFVTTFQDSRGYRVFHLAPGH